MTNLAGVDYLALEAIKPWLELCASEVQDTVREGAWSYEYCPVCGGSPIIGELSEEEGKKLLYCALCSTQWRYARLKCIFCGEADHKKLSYFSVEKDVRNRVDVCKSCKRYIKIVDRRQVTEPVFPDLENIATLHLDMVAQSKGYQARPVFPPSLIAL
jgi:FdhE protein